MASTIVRALIEDATWESIQAQPYDGTRYPCGCHPHPTEPHLSFRLCDYHDGFDSGVDRGCHELQTEIGRLRAERTAERALADRLAVALQEMFDPSLRDATHDEVIGVWKAAQDILAGWEETRREA